MRRFVALMLVGTSLAPLTSTAYAQVRDQDTQSAADDSENDKEIIVTGTNIRGVAPVGSSATSISRQDIERSGQTQISDLLRTLPQVQTNSNFTDTPQLDGPNANAFTGGGAFFTNQTRGNATDLRGLGPAATLTLIDGRRQLATGTTSSFVETNRLPMAAIDHIEVISDGASAIYGSDAVSGVINYITRKDYEGLEATGRYTTNKSYDTWGFGVTAGTKWNLAGRPGNIIVSYDYDHRERMTYGDNRRTRADQTPYGGSNALYSTGVMPAGPGYYLFNACATGTTFLAFLPAPNQCIDLRPGGGFAQSAVVVNYANIAAGLTGVPTSGVYSTSLPSNVQSNDIRTFLPENQRHGLNVSLRQEITDWLDIYYQFTGSLRLTDNITYGTSPVTISRGDPFFPTSVVPASVPEVQVPLQNYRTHTRSRDEQYSNTFGLRVDLQQDWQAEAYGSWSDAIFKSDDGQAKNKQPETAALNRLIKLGQYNPFLGLPIPQNVLDQSTLTTDYANTSAKATSSDYVIKLNGPLFDIAGGPVRTAVGFERLEMSNRYQLFFTGVSCPTDLTKPCTLSPQRESTRSGNASRWVNAVFGEVYVPFVGPENERPLLRRLALDLAVRAERYSDFGTTVNPKVGVTWGLFDGFSLRGSWGKAFRAPNLTEISASTLPVFVVGSQTNLTGNPAYGPPPPSSPATLIVGGANPDLGPERATNWSVGFDFKGTDAVSGLTVSGTYYNIHYKDKIVSLPVSTFLANAQNAVVYAPYLTPVRPVAGCDPLRPETYAPAVREVLRVPPVTSIGGTVCNTELIIDARWQNAASVFQDGIDFNFAYRFDVGGAGTFNVGANMTKILRLHEELIKGRRTTPDPVDRIFNPISFRARGNLGWARGPFNAGLTINYTPGYLNDVGFTQVNPPPGGVGPAVPPVRIHSWTTADLNLSVDLGRDHPHGPLSGLRLNINVQNVTDSDPPVVLTGTSFNSSYDARLANPYGRIFVFQVTKAI